MRTKFSLCWNRTLTILFYESPLTLFYFVLTGWLVPLLDRIARDNSTVVSPVIELIRDDDFALRFCRPRFIQIGGFSWSLEVRFPIFFLWSCVFKSCEVYYSSVLIQMISWSLGVSWLSMLFRFCHWFFVIRFFSLSSELFYVSMWLLNIQIFIRVFNIKHYMYP